MPDDSLYIIVDEEHTIILITGEVAEALDVGYAVYAQGASGLYVLLPPGMRRQDAVSNRPLGQARLNKDQVAALGKKKGDLIDFNSGEGTLLIGRVEWAPELIPKEHVNVTNVSMYN